jgi:hypothetical protein
MKPTPLTDDEPTAAKAFDGGLAGEIVSIAACHWRMAGEWVHCRTQGESEAALLPPSVNR